MKSKFIKCPFDKIKIGALDYDILYMDIVYQEASETVGGLQTNYLVMRLPETDNRFKIGETILHECLHALEYVMAVDRKGSAEDGESKESYIRGMTTGIGMLIRDNPLLFVFLLWLYTGLEIFNCSKYSFLKKKSKK